MKLREIKTYQSVKFFKSQETFFSRGVRGMEDLEMDEHSWGVRIRSPKNSVDLIISYNNVAYALVEEEKKAAKLSKA